jgi:hypothetical protein
MAFSFGFIQLMIFRFVNVILHCLIFIHRQELENGSVIDGSLWTRWNQIFADGYVPSNVAYEIYFMGINLDLFDDQAS